MQSCAEGIPSAGKSQGLESWFLRVVDHCRISTVPLGARHDTTKCMQAGAHSLTRSVTMIPWVYVCTEKSVQDVCEVTALMMIILNWGAFQESTEASAMHTLTAHEVDCRIGRNLHRWQSVRQQYVAGTPEQANVCVRLGYDTSRACQCQKTLRSEHVCLCHRQATF